MAVNPFAKKSQESADKLARDIVAGQRKLFGQKAKKKGER